MLTIVASRRRGDISTWEGRTFSLGDYIDGPDLYSGIEQNYCSNAFCGNV